LTITHAFFRKINAVAPTASAGGTANSLSGARVIAAMSRIAIAVLRAGRQIGGGRGNPDAAEEKH